MRRFVLLSRFVLLVALIGAAPPPLARAGGIRGTVWLSSKARATSRQDVAPRRGLLAFFRPNSAPAPRPGRSAGDVRDAVISLRAVPAALERKLAAASQRDPERMGLSDTRFEPRVAAIAAGTPLEFSNTGRLWHGAFSVAAAARFDLGKLPPGSTDRVTFARPGLVTVQCDLHPQETGYVLVLPHHAFTRPDASGSFTLPKLAPGDYELVVWHPDRGTRTRRLTVAKRGDAKCDVVF